MSDRTAIDLEDGIAIVGMAGRFPGAGDLAAYWRNLRDGVESIRFFSDEELAAAGVDPELRSDPRYVPAAGALDGVERFDAEFFGFEPREAMILDPQDRIFLECAWEALENAGYPPDDVPGSVGVFGGEMTNGYMLFNISTSPEVVRSFGWLHIRVLNDKDFLTTRVSYKLDLKGPSVAVQTACSTSLVAVHMACEGLLNGHCDLALAGGISIQIPHNTGYIYREDGMNSPDGRCRAFDADAEGPVGGSGVGLVVLKRLEEALEDGDTIRAIIRGTSVNNDGSLKVGYLAPSVDAQTEAAATALGISGVDSRSVSYVEAHGTGTLLGDAVEVAALTQAFRQDTDDSGYCALGSVKPNIGHLDHASGVASLIKVVLALENERIPPSLNYRRPNPETDFESSPFFVNTRLRDWPRGSAPRRACVNSIGVGGTNAHVVLQEAPPARDPDPSRPWQLLLLSARTPAAVERAAEDLAAHLERTPDLPLADVAYTLHAGRSRFDVRRFVVGRDTPDAIRKLRTVDPDGERTASPSRSAPGIAFVLPSDGELCRAVTGALEPAAPIFREELDRCLRILPDPVRELLARPAENRGPVPPDLAEPLAVAVGHALARQWIAWGVRPDAVGGEGVGEITAACLAEVLPLERALALAGGAGEAERRRELEAARRRGPLLPLERGDRTPVDLAADGTLASVLTELGRLWIAGVEIDARGLFAGEHRRRVPLPTYPFERRCYWVEPDGRGIAPEDALQTTPVSPAKPEPTQRRGRS